MSGDYSRQRFDAQRDFNGVMIQQGRVHLDAEWNEQIEITDRRWRAETLDVVGRCGVPMSTPNGFKIAISTDQQTQGQLTIGRGRIYVDGILAENHGGGSPELDVVLAESRGSADSIPFASQPHPVALPEAGKYLVYVDVWPREVTFLEAPDLVEPAVAVDTTTRLQTAWQIKFLAVDDQVNCATPDDKIPNWQDVIQPSAGRLSTAVVDIPGDQGPCLLPPTVGFRGLENRLYRVEIHAGGSLGKATFKWSRDNASVVAAVIGISGNELTVDSIGRDAELRFRNGDWIEITDDVREFSGLPGELRQITVEPATRKITLASPLPGNGFAVLPADLQSRHTRIRRWDQSGTDVDTNNGESPIPGADTPVMLENGIQVKFNLANTNGEFHVGDYWVFAARTADASIEILDQAPPRGTYHHFGRLSIATFNGQQWTDATDCRSLFPPLSELTSLFYVSGDGQEVAAGPNALVALPQALEVGVANGSWPVPGANVRFSILVGNGRLQGTGNAVVVVTGADGVASCPWELDSTTTDQRVEAVLLDAASEPRHLPLRFNAQLRNESQSHGGCCVTVGKEGDFPTLNGALEALAGKVTDLCICLMAGDHELIGLQTPPDNDTSLNLSIQGCGLGTRLRIAETSWIITGMASFTLRDLSITADPSFSDPLQIRKCADVVIEGCVIGQSPPDASSAVVTIADAGRVRLQNNAINSTIPARLEPPGKLFAFLPPIAEMFDLANPDPAPPRDLAKAIDVLSKPAARDEFVQGTMAGLAEIIRTVAAIDQPLYKSLVSDLSAQSLNAEGFVQRIINFRQLVFAGLSLVLDGAMETCTLDNNQFFGAVSLYGSPGSRDVRLKQLQTVLNKISESPGLVMASQGTLHVRGNQLTRFVVSEEMIKSIIATAGEEFRIFDGIRKLVFFSDNKIDGNGNQLLAEQFSFNANSFSHVGSDSNRLAGWAIANSAVYIGNQSPIITGLGTQFLNASRISLPPRPTPPTPPTSTTPPTPPTPPPPTPKSTMNLAIDIQDV